MGQRSLVLASASPRRRALLAQLGLAFEIRPAEVDESVRPDEDPRDYVLRVSAMKAEAVAGLLPGRLILAADTSVVLEGEVLGKPADKGDAARILRRLSGRGHSVLTAVALDGDARASTLVETKVWFRELQDPEIAWYVATGEPLDKAGAYGIQGRGGVFVRGIEGSASNVVGLPLAETVELLAAAGFPLPWGTPP